MASCTIPFDLEPTYDRWSGLNLANRRTLIREDHPRRHLLRIIGSKLERLPSYGESNLTSFVACDLHDAEAIVECEPGRRCRRPNFCPFCSWVRYQDVFRALAPAIEATPERFFELTVSWNSPFPLSTGFDFDPLLAAWDLQVVLIEQAIRSRLFSGGAFCKQVEKLSFLPLAGLPHVHGVILADAGPKLGEDLHGMLVDSGAWKVFLKLFRRILPEGLQPDIRIETLGTSASVFRFMGYAMWPFWPAQEYRGAFEDAAPSERLDINDEYRSLLRTLEYNASSEIREDTHGRELYSSHNRFFRLGTAHWAAKDNACLPKVRWQEPEQVSIQEKIKEEAKKAKLKEEKNNYEDKK